ncbi:hypothetical protein [Paenibacillus illinoisensis]|uniref:hypothetical protein n=1 Tax=Paenibacillus illinoisensis TaxID=59845 RepID=UPI0011B7142E|nr:hypothetical protein [Paenibacillus illinoisensis]
MNDVQNDYVWGIFVVDETIKFPNFFPIGIYTTRDVAVNEINALPRDHNYQLLRLPLNHNFGYIHKKSGSLVGMNAIFHEHFHFKDES